MPRNQPDPQLSYKKASELDVKFSRDQASVAAPAFQNLPIELPADGKYQIELKGSDLHIYDTAAGVKKYKPSDPTRIIDVEFKTDTIEITCQGSAVGKIVLHTAPGVEDPRAITAADLKALPYIEEYEKLAAKTNPTVKDKERMIELVEQITNSYQEKADPVEDAALPAAEEKKKSTKKTPTKPSYSTPQSSYGTSGESSYSPPPGYYGGGGRSYGRSSG